MLRGMRKLVLAWCAAGAPAFFLAFSLAFLLAFLPAASCGQTLISLMPGVVNDPANLSLRREIFRYGLGEMCTEMLRRSVPLRLRDEEPHNGRFFPAACQVQELGSGNLFVQLLGHGYAWTNVTGRIGFEASAAVEYNHDFRLDGSTMYVYFEQRSTQAADFRPLMIERTDASGPLGPIVGLIGPTIQTLSQELGQRILKHEVARGVTVIRDDDGAVAFAPGRLEVGARPTAPYERGDSDWVLLANDRTELHREQRDYAGPFLVDDDDGALQITALVEGAPSVDVLVVPKSVGDASLTAYERQAQPPPLPSPPLFEDVATAAAAIPGRPPVLWKRLVPLPRGLYHVILDNTSTAGRTPPAGGPLDDRAALVSYAVQLGEAD
jgi:hypothetical protein